MHSHFFELLLSGNKSENILSAFTGFLSCVVGVVTFDTIVWPLVLAVASPFLGLIGKRLGEYTWSKIRRVKFRRRRKKNTAIK